LGKGEHTGRTHTTESRHRTMQAYKKYQRVNVSTADPLRIVIMLYEGAIKYLNQARRLLEEDGPESGQRIGRTLEIVNYLRNSLDHEQGGQISINLQRLYDYLQDILNEANIHRNGEKIDEAISLFQTLLEGWRGIIAGQPAETETVGGEDDIKMPPGGLSMVG
jgi:flagellar protein FliS